MTSFEEILTITTGLEPPAADEFRSIEWCDEHKRIAVARQRNGRIEIFLIADRIQARSGLIASHLEYDNWREAGEASFSANRLVFPPAPHFDAVVAFIVEELIRFCDEEDVVTAFARSEPIIEMTLRRTALSEDAIMGLVAELRFLEALLVAAQTPEQRALSLAAWQGFRHTARDFCFRNRTSIEVKSTRASRSRHVVSSLAQVDPKRNATGDSVERLYLFSMGIILADPDQATGAITLPEQVDRILVLLGPSIAPGSRNEVQELFIQHVSLYGGSDGAFYSHDEMRNSPAYTAAMSIAFQRIYDMNDPKLDLLRVSDVAAVRHIDPTSVTCAIELPEQVDGDLNPETDLSAFARRFVRDGALND